MIAEREEFQTRLKEKIDKLVAEIGPAKMALSGPIGFLSGTIQETFNKVKGNKLDNMKYELAQLSAIEQQLALI